MLQKQMPTGATAALVLADGRVFFGRGIGAKGETSGEICFNTSMTGYQEIMTDPSYAGQIITFTFPHIGNVGANKDDHEAVRPFARGLILRADITAPSNHRSEMHFNDWLAAQGLTGICGIDTRALTHHLRDHGAQNGVIAYADNLDIESLKAKAAAVPSMNGLDIARTVSTPGAYKFGAATADAPHVVVIDYGVKRNILNCLAAGGHRLTVVPCTSGIDDILALNPDGVFLSNGPGDPAATGRYAVPVIRALLEKNIPLFGICLGHQLLALALGGKTGKLPFGHRGANHPVKNLLTGAVEITSQNHGFHVLADSLPEDAAVTHVSLFDGTNEGIALKSRADVFSVQYHPEASPGPHDSHYLFKQFATLLRKKERKAA